MTEPPQILYEIILQLLMSIRVTNFYMHTHEINEIHGHLVIDIRKKALTLIETNIAICLSLAVTLDDYVVHDHTIIHHLPHLILTPGKSRVPNNSKSRLEHTNYMLGILLAPLPTVCKV
jgi:hypothetical protein